MFFRLQTMGSWVENGMTFPFHHLCSLKKGSIHGSITVLEQQIEIVMKETQKGNGVTYIAEKYGMDKALVEQIARLYVTHPGVTADGIMTKMGI